MTEPLRVDIWSDVVCPWCYLGKRRFEGGLAKFQAEHPEQEVLVEYHSFELAPDTPADYPGTSAALLSELKGIPIAQVNRMMDHVTELAAAEGLAYRFEISRPARTRKAHELLHLAKESGRQAALKERLLAAHFCEGRYLGSDAELIGLAVEVGLDRDEVSTALADRRYAPAVDADIAQAREYGINGVPFYVLDNRLGVSGAQSPEVFAQALTEAVTKSA